MKNPESNTHTCHCPGIRALDAPYIIGTMQGSTDNIPIVSTTQTTADKLGSYKARWHINRMDYRIKPGLYAVGCPTNKSPVFVSANYKMSFDRLRFNLKKSGGWILVLDTKGINVWCAAGKGTFGTVEIIERIENVRLNEVVSHRRIILPQLGGPGVSAHEVKKGSGFNVIYGPIRARDIPEFLESGLKATPQMRRVHFPVRDRIALIPSDLVGLSKYAVIAVISFLLLSGFGPGIYLFERVLDYGVTNAVLILITFLMGTTLTPALLPWLPGRAFSVKGLWAGLILVIGLILYSMNHPDLFKNDFSLAAWFFMIPAVASAIAMNFTGSSTYTSLSGVRKEMRIWIPIQISLAVVGLGLWITGLFT